MYKIFGIVSCGESEQSGALAELFHVDNSVLELLIIDVAPRAGLKKSKWTGYSVLRRLNYFHWLEIEPRSTFGRRHTPPQFNG